MIHETIYTELTHGVCEHCGKYSEEIDPNSGWCIDCIEEERFYQESMRMASYRALKDW